MAGYWNELSRQVRGSASEIAQKVSSSSTFDGIPLASQGKSLVQAASGDREGAQKTQDNFTKRCVGISQLRSAMERHGGDEIAAAATQAEFDRGWKEADEGARAVLTPIAYGVQSGLAPMAPVANSIAKSTEEAIRPVAQGAEQIAQGAEQAVQRARTTELGRKAEEVGSGLARKAEQGAAAAERVATSLYESDLSRKFRGKFGELLAQHQSRSEPSDSCGASSSSSRGPISTLDKYTILAEASGPQCGVQCSCCLEIVKEGEAIRVLPCFHALHHHCAEQWLLKQPICPVCRCDLVASLEAMQR